jgi:hypothetical protein
MNERIKQLMLKAGGVLAPAYVTDANDNSVWTEDAKVDTIDMDAEYFAKLLLRECANYLDDFNKENMVEEGIGGAELKKHFGVDL